MTIDTALLRRTVEEWQAVSLPEDRAALIAADVGRFNAAALTLAAAMPFEAEPATFEAVLDRYAEE